MPKKFEVCNSNIYLHFNLTINKKIIYKTFAADKLNSYEQNISPNRFFTPIR